MQDYRRQIAYLYTYEHGQPVKNSGFVKAELRDGRCRLGIHLKGYSRKGQDTGKAYIYFCREDTGIGIYLGEMEDRNGVLEWQGAVDPEGSPLLGNKRDLDSASRKQRLCGRMAGGAGRCKPLSAVPKGWGNMHPLSPLRKLQKEYGGCL